MNQATSIQPLAPSTCPQCQGERTFAIMRDRIQCRRCGYSMPRPGSPRKITQAATPPPDPRSHIRPSTRINHRGEINAWAKAAYNTAQQYISQQKWNEAIVSLRRSLESQHDFVDANYWLAMLVDDEAEKRELFSEVLAVQPDHTDAVRQMMVLNGDLTAEQVQALDDPYLQAEKREVGGAVKLETENLRCAACGSGNMRVDELTGRTVCESCGTVAKSKAPAQAGISSLTLALLKRRTEAVRWIVGEHLLMCESCGAQRTIPAQKLTNECPFCGSTHVVEHDVLDSFQQPDGLIPFKLSRKDAAERIKASLGGWKERLRGLFDDNSVTQTQLEAIYLPFWVFDAMIEITQNIVEAELPSGKDWRSARPVHITNTINDAMDDVVVCAVKSPSPLLTRKLGRFDLREIQPYETNRLAQVTAQLYSIDFDQASMNAREIISSTMRRKHGAHSSIHRQVTTMSLIKQMTFQLVLMPVWVGTIHETDNDVRVVLVNGQSGKVVLGKPKKPRLN